MNHKKFSIFVVNYENIKFDNQSIDKMQQFTYKNVKI